MIFFATVALLLSNAIRHQQVLELAGAPELNLQVVNIGVRFSYLTYSEE
jgi:hypothetical protein